ncbi:hypothetical protein G7B40_009190 [Aetokthonos hydrillicola Thurmond2011]|jgi:hypothetical protein|uniref:LysM domain-containing protein n=1 Tax=Aetokthonos hydrillicola Thurmond2011 TaxID=2712845 RepID=A0AAP5I469_9CYAN|nr:hypothetical protein [Aetokthonos hydrillicola]MBO3457576.1 hypothetical protein [Aetokthonos hydrillicola CCALA 1050]MBW4590909.1 hypothetical protein [Aetokthonos hydrillicola CCALA 1050]MDR9894742.1 hypothetical protein [Aetokthonos hydrillicola Thurmond2011]
MFEPTSRYYNLETTYLTTTDGRRIGYKRRRFLPQGREMPLLMEVIVKDSDRLDLIADSTLGVSEQFWQICDANNAMNPAELTSEPGKRLRIPIPQPGG